MSKYGSKAARFGMVFGFVITTVLRVAKPIAVDIFRSIVVLV